MDLKTIAPLIDNYPDDIVILDGDLVIRHANESFAQKTGKSLARLAGRVRFPEVAGIQQDVRTCLQDEGVGTQTFMTKWSVSVGEELSCQITIIKNWIAGHQVLLIKDFSHEDELHLKYRAQMAERDMKIQELNMMLKLLSKTRLVRDHFEVLEHFARHLSDNFPTEAAWLFHRGQFYRRMKWTDTPDKPVALQDVRDPEAKPAFKPAGDGRWWLYVPIQIREAVDYEAVFLIKEESHKIMNMDLIRALSEQIALLMENTELEKISSIDDLTQVRNSRSFRVKLDEYTEKYDRLFLAILDIDFFKKINDTWGHAAGDAVLRVLGKELLGLEKNDEVVARIGGEEFGVLLPNLNLEEVTSLLEKFRAKLQSEDIDFDGEKLKITVSIGACAWQRGQMSVSELYKSADAALYRSKTSGRNRLSFHPPKV